MKRVAFKAAVRPIPCRCGTNVSTSHDAGCPRTKNGRHLSEITPHTLRRTFGSALRRRGTALDVISKLLGHSSTKVTEESYVELEVTVIGRKLFEDSRTSAGHPRGFAPSVQPVAGRKVGPAGEAI